MSDLRKHGEKSTVVDVDHRDEEFTETGLCAEGECLTFLYDIITFVSHSNCFSMLWEKHVEIVI